MSQKMWTKSRVSNLYRHGPSGIYYARVKVSGVDKWATLETDVFSVAEQRLRQKAADLRRGATAHKSLTRGMASVGDAALVYQTQVELDTQLKPSSKDYRKATIQGLFRSWPELATRKLSGVTAHECERWAAGYAKAVHGTRFNNTLDTLRHLFALGIERGLIHRNPALEVGKVKVAPKKLRLPSREQFNRLLEAIEASGAWCARECADLVRFLAYSGVRITEAKHVEWKHVDGQKGVLLIEGAPSKRTIDTKNGDRREVPITQPMRELFERLADRDKAPRRDERGSHLMHVTECRGALDCACKAVGIPKLTHHDLRHLFATRCIESGVDIPTVSRWLGHKDGGALAMKTYGHLRDEHSQAMAAKVTF
jgi:integrase